MDDPQLWDDIRPWQRLANAIVKQAAHDYRSALHGLQLDPTSHSALAKKYEVERYFRSEWQMLLTKLDGEYLIEQIRIEEGHSR